MTETSIKHRPVLFRTGRLKRWLLLASQYAGAQLGIRAISSIAALLLVHLLSVQEYGIYTLLLANLTFLVGVSDFGATGSLMYFWRRSKARAAVFSSYLGAVFRLRQSLFLISAVGSLAYLVIISSLGKYELRTLAYGTSLMLAGTWFLIQVGTWLAVFRIQGRFTESYLVEATSEFVKLAGVATMWLAGFHSSTFAMATMLMGAIGAAWMIHRMNPATAGQVKAQGTSTERKLVKRAVLGQVLPAAPWTLFFVAQGPLIAWLAAGFGSVQNLAELGALGRISALIAMVSGFTIGVLIPRLSNVHDERTYFRYYVLWWVVLLAFGSLVLGIAWISPKYVLWLIGHQYSQLRTELALSLLTALVMTLEWYAGGINRARGWMGGQALRISVVLLGQAAMTPFLDFGRTVDLLMFSLGTAMLMLTVQLAQNLIGFTSSLGGSRQASA
jgi:O-antigen/teichoic acid export membrane protein